MKTVLYKFIVDIKNGEIDAKEIDQQLIAERLQKNNEEAMGRVFTAVAENYRNIDFNTNARKFNPGKKSHQLSITSMAICFPSAPKTDLKPGKPQIYIYSGSKDAVIVKWDFWTGERVHVFQGGLKPTKRLKRTIGDKNLKNHIGHNDSILCMDVSSDGKYLVTGGNDKIIYIWSTLDNSLLGKFVQHRDAVSGLKFRKGTNELFSCSFDRTVKVWNVDELSYVETLYLFFFYNRFGHQDKITCIDALGRDRCITTGYRDRTCRLWKIAQESQLVFRGGGGGISITEDLVVMEDLTKTEKKREKDNGLSGGSIEVVAMIDDEYFISGSDSGYFLLTLCDIFMVYSKEKTIIHKIKLSRSR